MTVTVSSMSCFASTTTSAVISLVSDAIGIGDCRILLEQDRAGSRIEDHHRAGSQRGRAVGMQGRGAVMHARRGRPLTQPS